MRIVRELAAERNPVPKIAFLTRLTEAAVREALGVVLTKPANPRATAALRTVARAASGRRCSKFADFAVLLGHDVDLAGLVLSEAQIRPAPAHQLGEGDGPALHLQGQLHQGRLRSLPQIGH